MNCLPNNQNDRGGSALLLVIIIGAFLLAGLGFVHMQAVKRQRAAHLGLNKNLLQQVNASAIRQVDEFVGNRYLSGNCSSPFRLKSDAPAGVRKHFRTGYDKFTFDICNPKALSDNAIKTLYRGKGRLPATNRCEAFRSEVKIIESNCKEEWLKVEATTRYELPGGEVQAHKTRAIVKCRPPDLPDVPTALVQVRNWLPTGPYASYNQVMATPVVGRLFNAKSNPAIVASAFSPSVGYTNAGITFAFDGKTGTQHWVSPVSTAAGSSPAIGDIDDDGKNEVVVVRFGGRLAALNGQTGALIWTTTGAASGYPASVAIADVDDDGKPDVISGGVVFEGGGTASPRSCKFSTGGGCTPQTESIVKDVRPDPGLEIMTNSGIYSGKDGHNLCAFSRNLWGIAVARLRKDEKFETVVGKNCTGGCKIYGYRTDTCGLRFSTTIPGGGGGPFNIADFDGDKELEMGTAGRDYYVVFETGGAVKWYKKTHDWSSAATGSTVFDFNGDGKAEVVYNDEHYLRVYDGENGDTLYYTPNSTGTLVEYPVVADVDGDGTANIVIAANNYAWCCNTGVRIFQSPLNDWVGTRQIWNQHGYYALNVKERGSVVGIDKRKIWDPYLEDEYLIGFRNNIPLSPRCFSK